MTNQALIENILDMTLSEKQIEAIKTGWNAFYSNPDYYKNSIVVDMVKMSLKDEEVTQMTAKEKIYTCSEEHCPSRLTEHEWFLYYIQEIDHDEYRTFVDWLADMLKTGLLVEEV